MIRRTSSPSFTGNNSRRKEDAIISAVSVCLVRSGISMAHLHQFSPFLEIIAKNAVAPPKERPSLSKP